MVSRLGSAVWEGRSPDSTGSSLIALVDVKEHVRRRKFWNRAFTSAALQEYEQIISKRALQLVELLSSHKSVDLNSWLAWYT